MHAADVVEATRGEKQELKASILQSVTILKMLNQIYQKIILNQQFYWKLWSTF